MKSRRPRSILKLFGVAFAIFLLLFNITSSILPSKVLGNTALAASSCPSSGPSVNGDHFTQIVVCPVDNNGNEVSSPSGYTVTITNGNGQKFNTSYADGFYFNNEVIPPLGTQNATCSGSSANAYALTISVSKGGKTYTQNIDAATACNYDAAQAYEIPVNVASTTQYGSVKGCITYTAQDGTKGLPFSSSNTNGGSPAQATITGPGSSGSSINVSFDSKGCLTGSQISHLAVGSYTIDATYTPGQTSHGDTSIVTYMKTFTVTANKATDVSGAATGADSDVAGANPSDPTAPTCEDNGSPFSWVFCGLITDLSSTIDSLYKDIIQPLLVVNPINLTDKNPNDPNDHTYEIWSNFRVYGDIFLVIALLVIVYSESIGGGMLDAYAVRKILPRLLVAAILINLSIYLVAIAVDVSNIVGHGINNLLQAPFQSSINSGNYYVLNVGSSSGAGTQAAAGTVSVATLAIVVAAAFKAKLVGSIIMYLAVTFLVPALFIFLAIMVTVILRRGLIILLIFLSPIAFALYCLPNTEQYFRRWWDTLFRTLLVYPIIAVMFAMGDILSVTITSSANGFISQYVATLIGAISLFVPIALIPFSFRIAGGILGRFHDFATQKATQAHQGFLGDKANPETLRGRLKFNKDVETEKAGFSNRAISARIKPSTLFDGKQRRANVAQVRDARLKRLGQTYFENDSVAKYNEGNDNYWTALASPEMAKRNRDAAQEKFKAGDKGKASEVAAWDAAIAAASVGSANTATRMAAAQKLFASGYQIADHEEGYKQMSQIVGGILGEGGSQLSIKRGYNEEGKYYVQAEGANAGAYANAMNQAQYGERTAGRFDLAGINNGTGYSFEGGMNKSNSYTAGSQAKPQTFTAGATENFGSDISKIINDNTAMSGADYDKNIQAMATQLAKRIRDAKPEEVAKIGAWHSTILGAGQNATGANMREISKQQALIDKAVEQLGSSAAPGSNEANFVAQVKTNISQYRRGPADGDRPENNPPK